jgi:hypothetical protein
MKAKDKFLRDIKEYAKRLKKASRWESSGRSIDYIKRDDSDCYAYEFYCYMRVLCGLRDQYKLEYVRGNGEDPDKFPRVRTAKRNAPYFVAKCKEGKLDFQVCGGTGVTLSTDGRMIYPDISFQDINTDEIPSPKDVLMIMDAKFKKNNKHKLPYDEIAVFENHVRRLGLQKRKLPAIKFNDELEPIKGNSLLTNARACNEKEEFLKESKIKEVEQFDVGKNYRVKG